MKKVTIILLVLFYSLSSSGMTVSLHYCCGKLDSVSFTGPEEKSCDMAGHVKKAGCCNDRQISPSISADQQPAAQLVQVKKQSLSFPLYSVVQLLPANYVASSAPPVGIGPEPVPPIPIFIRNCVFLI